MRHSKFILKRDLTLRHSTSTVFCASMWVGVTKRLLTRPDSAGLPNLVSLPPQPVTPWVGNGGMRPRGRGGTADSGEPGPAFTPGRYCTGENVSTKDHMAPFCIEPLDKWGGRGAGKLPEGTLPGGTGPAHLRQKAGSLGRMGAPFPH